MLDLLIRGGRVVDGTGNPWFRGDVAVRDGRIAAVGTLGDVPARRTLDADGLCVCPGFIDMHAHSDLQLLAEPTWEVKVAQGVTTDVVGQDGLGLAPVTPETAAILRRQLAGWNGDPAEVAWDWRGVGAYLDGFDRRGVAVNVAMLVPHGTVRLQVLGSEARRALPGEIAAMQALVRQGMEDGAAGLSAGLTYVPAAYADDEELVALCRVLPPYGGYYAPHQRTYGAQALAQYRASIDIGRRAGVPVHLTHALMNFPVNRGRAAELLALVDEARAEGVDVTLDSYPYLAGSTALHAYLPSWAQAGGPDALLARLRDTATRARIRQALEVDGSDGYHGVPIDWTRVRVAGVGLPEHRRYVGCTIAGAATLADAASPFDFVADLLLAERLGVGAIAFNGDEENVRAILRHPAHMAGSDGLVYGDRPHPRAWGTFARFLAVYVREERLVRLEEMVRKMTSLPAQRLGFFDRGVLRPGAAADVVCFDPERVRDRATYEEPRQTAEGIPFVVVNGVLVVDDGRHTGARPGRALRKGRGARVPERRE